MGHVSSVCVSLKNFRLATVFKYLMFTIYLSQTSCYTLVPSKVYSQSIPSSASTWPKMVPYPFGNYYQSSIPLHYNGRYFGNPYLANNLQNPDYYFGHVSSFSPAFDDSDYYMNILYYIPANRRVPLYDQNLVDTDDEIEDDYDESDDIDNPTVKPQKQWWLTNNVSPDEHLDVNHLKHINDVYAKSSKSNLKIKQSKNNLNKQSATESRYAGIDGFGRKKDRKQVYGSYRPASRKEDHVWVYGVPLNYDYEDQDVRDLKSLRQDLRTDDRKFSESSYASWASGNAKRDVASSQTAEDKRISSIQQKFVKALKTNKSLNPTSTMYDEGNRDYLAPGRYDDNKNSWIEYGPEQTSMFDTIKKLLALEDKVDESPQELQLHKMLKRKQLNLSSRRSQSTTTEKTSTTTMKKLLKTDETQSKPKSSDQLPVRNRKRSIHENKRKPLYTDEDSLGRQLTALRHMKS